MSAIDEAELEKLSFAISVVMERIAVNNRWQSEKWQLAGVLPDDGSATEPRILMEREGLLHKLYPGFVLMVFRDEGEGYYTTLPRRNLRYSSLGAWRRMVCPSIRIW